jgi:hypothetical protein
MLVVNYTAGNRIVVHGTVTLGSSVVGGATMLRLSACHQPIGGGALVDNDADWSLIRVPQNTRLPMAVSQRISGLSTGTYNVGICYRMAAGQAANWNDNDYVNLTVTVLQN